MITARSGEGNGAMIRESDISAAGGTPAVGKAEESWNPIDTTEASRGSGLKGPAPGVLPSGAPNFFETETRGGSNNQALPVRRKKRRQPVRQGKKRTVAAHSRRLRSSRVSKRSQAGKAGAA